MTKKVYFLTRSFPEEERFGIISQIRRAAISIPSSIAEGSGRNSDKDFRRFLSISLPSAYELETQIIISNDLKFLADKDYLELSENLKEIQKMIFGFRKSLKKK